MKMAWSGLLIGLSTISTAAVASDSPAAQGEQKAKFDISVSTLEPASPALQQLAKQLAGGATTDAFWQARQQEGTPLVEPFDSHHKRVTFLWRGAQKNVYLIGSPAGEQDPLFRLAGSDVWFRSYVVPADTLMQYKLAPDVPQVNGSPREQQRAIMASGQADPLNPQTLHPGDDRRQRYSLLALDPARYCTLSRMNKPIRYGRLTRHQLDSDFLGNTREIKIYRPRVPQPARWTLLLFDGKEYQDDYHVANVLDDLIARHALPPINVVFIDALDHARRSAELPPNPRFADFMAHELLPWLHSQGLTMQRQKTVLAGSSYGGLASAWVALRYPRLFGNVLSLSGSYWWAPKGEAPGWLTREYQQAPRYPVRFWLQAGIFETRGPGGGNYPNTRAFEQVLREKGYRVSFHSSSSGHDYAAWCEALVDGMRDFTGLVRQ
ncbi:alpha/beta hydrolase-fold protein [Scandinavium sp. V105_16]|uniref:Alpha/beta hydrolase-fold protein n=1 Tax=Scandinavium lactucae TaxID=3095028 RepID=A0AAJ2S507_9ENTR|nr:MULTISPECIES: alpha/beta hydrolase-fold protein [unclassified Scandinavium]MDX6018777.1 alpha/beta hydrolase-fold protein [Scandinavium sp. V105_16]MDX6030262.1 alpha/beta hydrolase-fold protein [Scandinavium sp. V105_12]